MAEAKSQNGDYRSSGPDPSSLTTQQLLREIFSLRELIETRLDASDKAVQVLQEQASRAPSIAVVDERLHCLEGNLARAVAAIDARPAAVIVEIAHLQKLMEEKFKGVDQQFASRDVALAAALLAQKTSVEEQNKSNALSSTKSEVAVTKQIDGIQTLISTTLKATDDKIDGVKTLSLSQTKTSDDKIQELRDRITAKDGQAKGIGDSWGILLGALSGIGVIVTLVVILLRVH